MIHGTKNTGREYTITPSNRRGMWRKQARGIVVGTCGTGVEAIRLWTARNARDVLTLIMYQAGPFLLNLQKLFMQQVILTCYIAGMGINSSR